MIPGQICNYMNYRAPSEEMFSAEPTENQMKKEKKEEERMHTNTSHKCTYHHPTWT